ncbi:MAG: PAS domain S-box protein [Bacteroidetes bacterium]|nr:PAS domain S-box protein [Bacteroidota bacterium]
MELYFIIFQNHIATSLGFDNDYIPAFISSQQLVDSLTFNKNLFRTFLPIIYIFIFSLIFKFFKINYNIKNNLVSNFTKEKSSSKEFQLYFLFTGLILLTLEITFEAFKLRPKSLFIPNTVIAVLLITIYFISLKSKLVFENIQKIFKIFFVTAFLYVCRNLIASEKDGIPVIAFLLFIFFSFNVLKPRKFYNFYIAFIAVFLLVVHTLRLIPIDTIAILINYSLIVICINYIRHLTVVATNDKFLFNNQIINKGNSLIIAINKKNEIVFCSETIKSLLGYTVEEALCDGYWTLTETSANNTIDDIDNANSAAIQITKVKCKNGDYKFIQWNDKKFSEDLLIGIGQDVTEHVKTQKRYENLVESAYDLIYELNHDGNFTFINKNSEIITGYSLEELYQIKFVQLIQSPYKATVFEFYFRPSKEFENFPILEFPILTKQGEEVWLSQKVTILRDEKQEITGYSIIARDITILKKIEKEKADRQLKNLNFSEVLKSFTEKSYSNSESIEDKLKIILQLTSKTIGVCRASYWEYDPEKITCVYLYEFSNEKFSFSTGIQLSRKSYPIYFSTIENKTQVVASNVYTNNICVELCKDYIADNNIKSLLDTPVFLNGVLKGIICFETTQIVKHWDNEDINFARSVSDIIAIGFESKMRLDIQEKLTYKSELLAAMTLCTEKFLNSKDIGNMFTDVLIIMGNATKSHRAYYYENNPKEKTISQKYRWIKDELTLAKNNPLLQHLPYPFFEELLHPLLDNKIYSACVSRIVNKSLRDKLINVEVKSLILFPIFVKDRFHGFLGFDDTNEERVWNEDEVNILQTLARNISASIEQIDSETIIYESEEKFRLLASNIPGTVYLAENDQTYTKIYLNDEIEKLTGYDKNLFLSNKLLFTDLIHPDDAAQTMSEIKANLLLNQGFHLTFRIIRKDQKIVWVEEFADVIIKNKKIAYIEGIMFDITQRKEADEAIKGRDYAEAANRAKSEFLANMSHEIRTPLNGIIGFTDLLMKTKLEAIQQKHMNTVNQSAHTLLEIINDILDFSKIEAGKLDLFIEKHHVRELLKEITDLILYEANQKNLKLELNIQQNIPFYFWTDTVRLKQILINLLANAVKFTEKGSIQLNVTLVKQISLNKTRIRFSVLDSGIGIQEKNKTKIFKAFSQEDSSTTKKFGGTGLGLTISNKLLGLMKSRLQLESQVGIGSEFYFDLDLKTTNEMDFNLSLFEKNNTSDNLLLFQTNEQLHNLKVMLVEDNKINMLLLKTIINNLLVNPTIYEIPDGLAAVNEFETINPDIIFMDIQMPKMNGYQATAEIRKTSLGKMTPIIAITAGTEKEEKNKCLEIGMNDYISKPIIKGAIEETFLKWML